MVKKLGTVASLFFWMSYLPATQPAPHRDYEQTDRTCVQELYRLNHINQTVDFVLQKKKNMPHSPKLVLICGKYLSN